MWVGFGSGTDSCTAANYVDGCDASLNHLISAGEQRGGTSRPSAFAVLRLITSLNLVGSLHRKLCRLGTLQYAIDLRGELGSGGLVLAVRHPGRADFTPRIDRSHL